jgi:hypothetical protein
MKRVAFDALQSYATEDMPINSPCCDEKADKALLSDRRLKVVAIFIHRH